MQRGATLALVGALLAVGAVIAVKTSPHKAAEEPASRATASAAPVVSAIPELPSAEPPPAGPSPEARPELPKDAPRSVTFGVIVLTYRGAEGAPPDARSKDAALARAKELIIEAQRDFDETVKKGDRGSMPDVGAVPQGVLEPPLEYALFTLKKGDVYGSPLDSPRGYWIVKRTK